MQRNNLMANDVVARLELRGDFGRGGEVSGRDKLVGDPGPRIRTADVASLRNLGPL